MHEPPQFSRTFETDGTFDQYARVKLDTDGKITIAALANEGIGIAMRESFAAGDHVSVALDGPIRKGIAAEAFSAGVRLHSAASGKLADTAAVGSFPRGIALEAASADGDIIDYLAVTGAEASA